MQLQFSKSFSLEQTAKTFTLEVYRFFERIHVRVLLYLVNSQTGQLTLQTAEGAKIDEGKFFGHGDEFDRWVIQNQQSLVVSDTHDDFRFKGTELKSNDDKHQVRSVVAIPLRSSHQILGVLRLESELPNFFDTNDLRLFVTVGEVGSIAIENARFYEKLLDIAVKDSLTGLYLRRQFIAHLEAEFAKRVYATTGLALILLDLDHFKKCNDQYGHMAGDIVLKWIGTFLSEICKERGLMVCRYGGEEFCILVPHARAAMAIELAEKIRLFIEKHEFEIRREKFSITVSVGVADFPDHAHTQEQLIHRADQAMYAAKKQGRNRVCRAEAT